MALRHPFDRTYMRHKLGVGMSMSLDCGDLVVVPSTSTVTWYLDDQLIATQTADQDPREYPIGRPLGIDLDFSQFGLFTIRRVTRKTIGIYRCNVTRTSDNSSSIRTHRVVIMGLHLDLDPLMSVLSLEYVLLIAALLLVATSMSVLRHLISNGNTSVIRFAGFIHDVVHNSLTRRWLMTLYSSHVHTRLLAVKAAYRTVSRQVKTYLEGPQPEQERVEVREQVMGEGVEPRVLPNRPAAVVRRRANFTRRPVAAHGDQ